MSDTPNLALPLLAAAQAQKHVTHNEALLALDALVQLAVADRDLATPPSSPADGARFIVAAAPTGAWAGHAGQVAEWRDGAWAFFAPKPGFIAFAADEGQLLLYAGGAWAPLSGTLSALGNLSRLGIGTNADATNPFAAKLNKALWTAKTVAEGGDGDLRYTLNKETASDVLSFLMQTGYSGRAELGLLGDDRLAAKVSADGSAWATALALDPTGNVLTPSQVGFEAYGSGSNTTTTADGQVIGPATFTGVLDLTTHNVGGGYNASNGRFTAPVAGRYLFYAGLYVTGVATEGRVCFGRNGSFDLNFQLSFHAAIPAFISRIFGLSAGDYVDLRVGNQSSAGGAAFSFWAGHTAFGGILLA